MASMATMANAAVLLRRAGGRQLPNTVSTAAAASTGISATSLSCRRPLSVAPLSFRRRQPQMSPPPPPPQGRRGRLNPTPSFSVARGASMRLTTATINNAGLSASALASTSASARRSFSSDASTGGGGEGGDGGATKETGPAIAIGSALRFKTIVDGKPMVPEDFQGKAVLVVNTASLCGLTPQLKELELVHKRFREEGLVVIGIPSNDFGAQEPWEEEKIKEFYAKDFGVTFPLTSKTVVVGPEAHPLYSAVIAEFGADVGPQWNFHKLLVDADGALAGVFGSNLSPLEPDMTEAIEEALPTKSDPA